MNSRRLAIAGVVVFGAIAAWVLFIGLPRWYSARMCNP